MVVTCDMTTETHVTQPHTDFSYDSIPDHCSDNIPDIESCNTADHNYDTDFDSSMFYQEMPHPLHSTLIDEEGEDPPLDFGYAGDLESATHQLPTRPAITPMKVGPYEYAEVIAKWWPHPTPGFPAIAPVHFPLYVAARDTNLPNYLMARRQVPSALKCDTWDRLLLGYGDSEIVEYLRFGWPSSYTAPAPPEPTFTNHPSALAHADEVDRFINKELELGAMLGPFPDPPFKEWTQTSPLMTIPKKDSHRRRVIIDLSFPLGRSVNSGVGKNVFQGREYTYSLPTVTDLANIVLANGPGSYLWKADLERAYRQLRSDPLDYPLMCIKHKDNYFVDICPSFGCRGSGAAQQRVSSAVCYLMDCQGHMVLAYVDDFCGAHKSFHHAMTSFMAFEQLCQDLGLKIAPEKSTFPATSMEWLGFNIDTVKMEITIPTQKLDEVLSLATHWSSKPRASKRDYQSLAGKLNHIGQCVAPARKFMARILSALRAAPPVGTTLIHVETRRDIAWFRRYAATCNGRLLITKDLPTFNIECDACLSGGGGFSSTHFYSTVFPRDATDQYHISQLEAINIVMAFKALVPSSLRNTRIIITTDNMSAMYSINSGKTRDPVLAACSRELWLAAALQELEIAVAHAPGATLVLADALSRMNTSPSHHDLALRLTQEQGLALIDPPDFNDLLSNDL